MMSSPEARTVARAAGGLASLHPLGGLPTRRASLIPVVEGRCSRRRGHRRPPRSVAMGVARSCSWFLCFFEFEHHPLGALTSDQPGLAATDPKAIDFDSLPSCRQNNGSGGPFFRFLLARPSPGKPKSRLNKKPFMLAKNGPALGCSGKRSGRYSSVWLNRSAVKPA
jgi:hypothetical protein